MVSLKKRENEFYVYLKEFADMVCEGADVFKDLVDNYENIEMKITKVKEFETDCDAQGHKILVAVNNSFVTPLDREDLYTIVKEMDDIIDALEQVASRFIIFDIKELKPGCSEMTNLIVLAIKELNILFEHLSELKKNNIVREQIIEVNRLENEGDVVHRSNLTKLFKEEKDPIELIKWKHLYEELEECLDSCENVANTVEGIVMKYA